MVQTDFETRFIEWMKRYGLEKPDNKNIEFEWIVFREFQEALCRDVGFEEYLGVVELDWLVDARDLKPGT